MAEGAGRRFAGRVAVVTGAASGFGREIAQRFSDEGAAVVVGDIDAAGGARAAVALSGSGGEATFVQVDVSSSAAVAAMVETAVRHYGGIDVLVNNAGFSHRSRPLVDLDEESFDRVFAVNVRGVYLGVRHTVPVMRERGGGVIVNTASIGAVAPRPGMTAYNATKGAVVTMTRGLAVELAPDIRVCAVNPVAAETGFMRGALGIERLGEDLRSALVEGIPMGRLAQPADVAAAVCFLASDDASFLTGVCLDVDGGRSIS